jgi:hypothetical protein
MYEVFIIAKLKPLIEDRIDHNKKTAQVDREVSPVDIIS